MRKTQKNTPEVQLEIRLLCVGLAAATSLAACGKSAPDPSLDPALFQHRFVRSLPPEWATTMVTERHFRLKTQQMEGSIYAPIAFRSLDECKNNLRNYIAWKAQVAVSGSGQTFIHAIAADQFVDKLPEVGPELVTLQCFDIAGAGAASAVPAPAFANAEKVADQPLTQDDLPKPTGGLDASRAADAKPVVYLDPKEPFPAQGFDRSFNAANQIEPYPITLGIAVYDVASRGLVKVGRTPYEFDDFRTCWGNVANFMAYMTPHMKGVPHWPKRFSATGEQYIGRDPQSGKVLLVVAECVQKTDDGKFTGDPKRKVAQPAFDLAQDWVARGGVR
ncbi:hypothetical protein [Caballeronia sp. ATUFL_M1_KS5A]|uniref:hypothetical protein n=1 Tax=Caballeronia sp. ATUFL_M1_KS5A TaxID=2921778 RepID=UPI0020277701|nr:hypothetical protein [Caballeronia sp. ATUFL_M1_KS5A]